MTVAVKMSDANKEIAQLLSDVWSDPIHWPGVAFKEPKKNELWARFNLVYDNSEQATLATVTGKRRWLRSGNVIIQVFAPLNNGLKTLYDAAEIVVGAYEGKRTSSGVWFRNVRVDTVSAMDAANVWQQANVIAEFEYDQIK